MQRTNRLWRSAVVLATLAVLVLPSPAVAADGTGSPATACSDRRLASMAPVATPDAAFNDRWAAYGNDNTRTDDWTGGDATYSVELPSGRMVWMFSDTFLGTVNPDGTRPTAPIINNSYVIQREESLVRTLHGGTRQAPTALIAPLDASWYWMNDAIVEGTNLRQFLSTFERTGPGPWDWEWIRTDVASYSLSTFTLTGVQTVPGDGNGVDYGTAMLTDGDYTYVYGVEDLESVKYMHVARASAGSVLGPWSYWTGSAWSSNPMDSARIRSGVSNSFSVVRSGSVYVLLTQDSSVPFGSEIVAYFSCRPQGPWGYRTHVYTTPESGGDLYTYNALAHPELADASGALVSYNVNTFDGSQHLSDVTIYRPRFLRVTFSG
jgi:hypothetical protein